MSRIVLRGGTVLDGTGGPAQRPTSSSSTAVSPKSARQSTPPGRNARCRRRVRGARLHRHPHPPRPVAVLGRGGATRCPNTASPRCSSATARSAWCRCAPTCIDEVSKLFCYIEDMPRETFELGIPWNWETYPAVPRRVERRRPRRERRAAARPLGDAALRDGCRRMGARRHRRRTRRDRAPARRSDDRGRVRVLHFLLRRRRAEPAGAEPSRRPRRARRPSWRCSGRHGRGFVEFIPRACRPPTAIRR